MKGLFGSQTCRPGVKSGESTIREVAAYLLDSKGFSGVPATTLVEMSHKNFVNDPLDEKDAVNAESREIVLGLVKFKMAKNESTESSSVSSEQPLIVKTGSL